MTEKNETSPNRGTFEYGTDLAQILEDRLEQGDPLRLHYRGHFFCFGGFRFVTRYAGKDGTAGSARVVRFVRKSRRLVIFNHAPRLHRWSARKYTLTHLNPAGEYVPFSADGFNQQWERDADALLSAGGAPAYAGKGWRKRCAADVLKVLNDWIDNHEHLLSEK